MDLAVLLAAFGLIAPVELPDKTFVATLVLATRYRAVPVWLGVLAAFAVQCGIAVTAGSLLTLLPERPVQLGAAVLFAVGAVVLFVGARKAGVAEREAEEEYAAKLADQPQRSGWRAAGTSFLVLFTAEWGDLSQLLTAGLVARYADPISVFAGSFLALAVVSGAAVLLGRWIVRRVSLVLVRYVGATVCAALAVLTVVGLASG
ncbi:MAG: TMEM165/GDT1 family protein [Micromonosporaceae bacterium]